MNMPRLSGIVAFCLSVATTAGADPAWVGRTALNLRSGPGIVYERITTLPACSQVTVLDHQGGWTKVRAAGQTAWVAARYLRGSPCAVARSLPPRVVAPEVSPPVYVPAPYAPPGRIAPGMIVPKYQSGIFRG